MTAGCPNRFGIECMLPGLEKEMAVIRTFLKKRTPTAADLDLVYTRLLTKTPLGTVS